MARKIFRQEVAEAQANRWLGEIRSATPISLKVGVAVSMVAAIVVVGFLVFGSYTRREVVLGTVVSNKGVINIRAVGAGEVGTVNVAEGDEIQTGDLLTSLRKDGYFGPDQRLSSSLDYDLADQRSDVEAGGRLNAEKSLMRARALGQSRGIAIQRESQASAELLIYQQEVEERELQVAKIAPLVNEGYMSETQYREMRANLASARANLERQRSTVLQIRQEVLRLDEEQKNEEYAARAEQYERAIRLSQLSAEIKRNTALGELQLRASQAGTIAAVLVKPGEFVLDGQLVAVVVPADAKMEVELMVPSKSIGFVNTGAPVNLKLNSFPYEKFGLRKGVVSFVSTAPLSGPNEGTPDTTFLVRVRLSEQYIHTQEGMKRLMPGMETTANILLDRRKLYEWILKPVYKMPEANND